MTTIKNKIENFDSKVKVWNMSLDFVMVQLNSRKMEFNFLTQKTIHNMTIEDRKELIDIARQMRAESNKLNEMLNYLSVLCRDCGVVDVSPVDQP